MKLNVPIRRSLWPMLFGAILMVLCATTPAMRPAAANNNPPSPEALARLQQWRQDTIDAFAALKAKDYATAEADFKNVNSFEPDGEAYFGLALIYTAQGRIPAAFQMYHEVFHPSNGVMTGGTFLTRAHLEYALLLNRAGRWSEAVASYRAAVPDLARGGDLPSLEIPFDPDTPQPVALEAATHVALGLDANWHCDDLNEYQHDRAFSEYTKALQMEPNWAAANYYYGYGWGRLDRKSRARIANAQQAQAALQKAVKLAKGPIKIAAQKALLVAMKTE